MQNVPILTDRSALERNRARAARMVEPAMFLQDEARLEIKERLKEVNRTFTAPAIVTGFPDQWQGLLPDAHVVPDTETLNLTPGAHDLVIHAMGMHWANDPVGQIAQSRRALKPDGLFLAVFFGGQTLQELRDVLTRAEAAETGGLSPRIAPMGEIRDLGSLLQRAGFALPVADSTTVNVTYETAFHLMRDIRAMGEANALAQRNRLPLRRGVATRAGEFYHDLYGKDGRIPATFELIVLTGWAPDDSQQKPLRPGSATSRLADVLGTRETKL